MAPDTHDTAVADDTRPACPDCGHDNIPNAAFCARCGRSLHNDPPEQEREDASAPVSASQVTSTYAPISSTVTPATSPWARPDPAADDDPGLTTALPTPTSFAPPDPVAAEPMAARGMLGFWLGVIAMLLFLSVLAIYIYAAWLSDSARSSIDGWLPWM